MRIVFMGTPDFAVPCLARLIQDGHDIPGVFSQPDKPRGRGYTLTPPPVKELALAHGIPVHQPAKLRDGEAERLLRELAPELIVVVAYGKILPPQILEIPPLGCVNVHASLLPKLRGAAPIQWSIIGGDEETGVTTMYMAEGMDTGDIILQRRTPIGPEETAGELFARLSALGAQCLAEILPLLAQGTAPRIPQDEAAATYAPMLDKQTGMIDFSKSAREICCLVRGVTPAPGARTLCGGKLLKVHRAAPAPGFAGEPGRVLDDKRLVVGCGDSEAVELLTVQPEGKKPMEGAAFLCGRGVKRGEKLTAE